MYLEHSFTVSVLILKTVLILKYILWENVRRGSRIILSQAQSSIEGHVRMNARVRRCRHCCLVCPFVNRRNLEEQHKAEIGFEIEIVAAMRIPSSTEDPNFLFVHYIPTDEPVYWEMKGVRWGVAEGK